jgi:endonuclease III
MAETLSDRKRRVRRILDGLARMYPDARIELESSTPLELLVATILSAQCTDQRVNQVTAGLFPKYRTAHDWAAIPPARLEHEIHSTGFYRAKAKSILGMARALMDRHGGEVPRALDELTALPGVGRKTANVVLGNAFGIPALAVDTHVTRVSQRLGLTRATDAEKIHDDLVAIFPPDRLTQASHLLIWHGRRTCQARAPKCPECGVRVLCPWPAKTLPSGAKPAVKNAAKRRRKVRKG